jgi:nucleoside-diphosphate-sugar epimerase
MRVLVVGGTGFLGGAVAHAAHEAGHSVAILTRALTKGLPRLEGTRAKFPTSRLPLSV